MIKINLFRRSIFGSKLLLLDGCRLRGRQQDSIYCLAGKGKAIEVCDSGETIDYSFGKTNKKPEIALRVPRSEASTNQWHGGGPNIFYTVEIPNRNTTYSVFWSMDRMSEEHSIDAGVYVETNKKHVATVKCIKEIDIVQYLERYRS